MKLKRISLGVMTICVSAFTAFGMAFYEAPTGTDTAAAEISLTAEETAAAEFEEWYLGEKRSLFVHYSYGGPVGESDAVNPPGTIYPDGTLPTSVEEVAAGLDAEMFAEDCQKFGFDSVIFTVAHRGMYLLYPSAVMTGWGYPEHTSQTDLIGEVITACKARGIKVVLYANVWTLPDDDKELLGWNETDNFQQFNDDMYDWFEEMLERYADDIHGWWFDAGLKNIDRPRLSALISSHNPNQAFYTGTDNMRYSKYDPDTWIDNWAAVGRNNSMYYGGPWYARYDQTREGRRFKDQTVEYLYKYTVLQAACVGEGTALSGHPYVGSTMWGAGPYVGGDGCDWETGVEEDSILFAQRIRAVDESITGTRPSASYITRSGSTVSNLQYGVVATTTPDASIEYIHVLRPPSGSTLTLPVPANNAEFNAVGEILPSGELVQVVQDASGVTIVMPENYSWDPIGTVIKLVVDYIPPPIVSAAVGVNSSQIIPLWSADFDGVGITYTIVTAPTNGALTGIGPDLTYTPNPDYVGSDSFTYTVSDGETDSDIATALIKILAPGQLAYWALNETSGTEVADSSGNGFGATLVNGTWTNGYDGGALNFGSKDSVRLPAEPFSIIEDEVSIAMWVYGSTNQPQNDSVIYAVNSDGERVLNVHLPWSSSMVYWDAGNESGYDRLNKVADDADIKGQWNHWVFTKNATAGTMKIYLNGALWHSGANKTKSMSGITAATLGSQISGSNYDGMIDEVRLYDIALTDVEVAAVYASENIPPVANALAVTVDQDDSVAITLTGSGAGGGSLTYTVETFSTNGTLSGTAPDLTYTPDADYNGLDSFTYTVSDGTINSAAATVSITVNPVADPAIIVTTTASATLPTVSSNDLAQIHYLSSSGTGGNQADTEHAELFNGLVGNTDSSTADPGEVTMTSANTITVEFDLSTNTNGYDLTGITTVFGWNPGATGRSNQGYEMVVTYVDDSSEVLAPAEHWEPNSPSFYWTTVSFAHAGGILASGVKAVTFDITEDANAGGVVIAREFDVFGVPTVDSSEHIPEFLPGIMTSNGNFNVQFSGSIGQNYRVERIEDLTSSNVWQVVTNIEPLVTSPIDVSVRMTNSTGFFRVILVP